MVTDPYKPVKCLPSGNLFRTFMVYIRRMREDDHSLTPPQLMAKHVQAIARLDNTQNTEQGTTTPTIMKRVNFFDDIGVIFIIDVVDAAGCS